MIERGVTSMSRVLTTLREFTTATRRKAGIAAAMPLIACLTLAASSAGAGDDAYRPSDTYTGQSGVDTYRPSPPPSDGYGNGGPANGGSYRPYNGPVDNGPADNGNSNGYGEPYSPPPSASRDERYEPGPQPHYDDGPPHASYSEDEIVRAGNNFFGKVSGGLASAIEWTFQKAGRPNGYILGQDAGGAFVAGLAYGEGTLYTKDAGSFKVYWQGPSVGYDFGADGSKVMTLVYNLRDPSDIYDRFGGVEGTAYLVGGISVQLQKSGHVTLAPIRAGVGLRLGANVGYLKYTRSPTWNPF
jgi:hypothetical protein